VTGSIPSLGAPSATGALAGHVSIVTGGNSGIGLGIAHGLAAAGASVAIFGTNAARNAAAAAELEAAGPGRVMALRCDVSDEDEVGRCVDAVRAEVGPIGSLFLSAAVPSQASSFLEMSAAEWRRVLSVNLDGAFFMTRTVAAHMVADGAGGSLVGIASLAAVQGQVRGQQYAASKGGLLALMRSCAVELARHQIRANVILPGSFLTPMSEPYLGAERYASRVLPRIPMRRCGDPDDLAGLAVYLAGPWSRYHTGDALVVDGGYSVF
jgi:NAD(P)-dependent dehydrogenase (short-subunit alcohol dehydrogenase family)